MTVIRADELEPAPEAPSPDSLHSRTPYVVALEIAGSVLEIRSSEAELCETLARRFRDHLCATRAADVVCFVVREKDGYLFSSPGTMGWRWRQGMLPADALAFLSDAAAISAFVRSDKGIVSYHAASLESHGRAAAIAGISEAGKTTTLLACARLGLRVFSDERLLLRDGTVRPFLRTCGIREGGARRLLADDAHDALAMALTSGANDLSLVETFGRDAVAEPAPLFAAFILDGHGSHAEVAPITAYEAAPALTRWADGRSGQLGLVAQTLELLAKVRCYRLTLGSPAESANRIRETLNGD